MPKLKSLLYKAALLIFFVFTMTIACSVILATHFQRQGLLEAAEQSLVAKAKTSHSLLTSILLNGDASLLPLVIDSIKGLEEMQDLKIYRADGALAFSTSPGAEQEAVDFPGYIQWLNENTPLFVENHKKNLLEYYYPIDNLPECTDCPPGSSSTSGAIYTAISMEWITGKVYKSRLQLGITFFLMGIAIFIILMLLIRKSIIAPILLIEDIIQKVEAGNYEVEVPLKGRDEISHLGDQVNRMIEGLKSRQDLSFDRHITEIRLEEDRKFLDNIREGLILVDRDLVIQSQYSLFLEDLFQEIDIEGNSIIDFLNRVMSGNKDVLKNLNVFLNSLLESTESQWDELMANNPIADFSFELKETGKTIYLHTYIQKIIKDGKLENLMIIFEDKTGLMEAKEKAKENLLRREAEVEQIATILQVGSEAFVDFIREAWITTKELKKIFQDTPKDPLERESLLRDLHSMKGAARYLGFHSIEEEINKLEGFLPGFWGALSEESQENIQKSVGFIQSELSHLQVLNDRFKDFWLAAGGDDSEALTTRGFLSSLRKMVKDLSVELNKKTLFVINNRMQEIPYLSALRNPIIHLIRNAMDHGVEEPMERLAKDKVESATISLSIQIEESNVLTIRVKDDGHGIHLPEIRDRGFANGLLKNKNENRINIILGLLFMPGFSSKTKVSKISGRGIGLDVVKTEVEKLNGRIRISTKADEGAEFIIQIPLRRRANDI